jgi:hypothetical protein
VIRWLLAIAVVAACAKKQDSGDSDPHVPAMSAEEVQRSQDACKVYVDKVCACAVKVPAVKQQCDLARALPDAVRIGVEVASNPSTAPKDVRGAQDSVRKTFKECVEQTAKLPALGCP